MKGIKMALACCMLASMSLLIQAQTIVVDLKKGISEEPVGRDQFWLYPRENRLSGIPKDLDTMMTWVFPFTMNQMFYEQYQYGRYYENFENPVFTKERFDNIKMDRSKLTDKDIKYKLYGISGFRNGKKVIVVDFNNNYDLSDEMVLEVDTSGINIDDKWWDAYQQSPFFVAHYEVFDGKKVIQKEKIVRIQPFVKLKNPYSKMLEDLKFTLLVYERFTGTFSLGSEKYNLSVDGMTENNGAHASVYIAPYGQSGGSEGNIGGSIKLGNKALKLDSLHWDVPQLFMSMQGEVNENSIGGMEGMAAPEISMQDLDGNDFNLKDQDGKYTFIAFWGTWCGPCKADHPNLKRLYGEYKGNSNIEFIGVAWDKSADSVKNYLLKEEMNWRNLFANMNNRQSKGEQSIIDRYDVHSFPTYFLIDPSGKIIVKTNDLNVVEGKVRADLK